MMVETESLKLNLTNEHIQTALMHCMNANYRNQDDFVTSLLADGVLIIAFKGPMAVDDLYQLDDHFGETNVDCNLFPSLQRIGMGQLAKVNGTILQAFQNLLINSGLKSEVEIAITENKKILFAGHSLGGALASLATLWMLDNYTRIKKIRLPIGCVTFGSPLIGDGTLTHAVQREKWASHFTHFVMERDIVARMMLAPKASFQECLSSILNFFQQNTSPMIVDDHDHDHLVDRNQAIEFFENVLVNASNVASHDAFDLMEPTNSLKERLAADYVKISPYRPFGVYIFCTRDEYLGASVPRQLLVVENANVVLQLLFYFLQLPNEDQDLAQFALQSLTENLGYQEEMNKNGLRLENLVNLKDLMSNGTTSDAVRTRNKALFELPTSAKWCLLAAEEAEKRKKKNADDIKKSMRRYTSTKGKTETETKTKTNQNQKTVEGMIDKIREYKEKPGEGQIDYYEAFKLQNEHSDFEANISRLEQAKIWDEVIEMVMRKDLPDEFEVWDELVDLGTKFRRLYEPLDIANYYRHLKGDGYLAVRPKRYKFTQRWFEHKNVSKFELVSESNFVAEVEELMKLVMKPKNKMIEEIKKDFASIKAKVEKWRSDEKIADEKIANDDVFWGDYILSKLQEELAKTN